MVLVVIGVGLSFLGDLSTLYIVVQYAFLVVLAGLALTFMGWRGFKEIWVPLLLLAFMIPLPTFCIRVFGANRNSSLRRLGVAIIRLFGISVLLEGNVIDLGNYKLQVAEACNGLRYLFPLMALGFIAAYFFKGALWKRAIIFLSTIPITILMNSFRIAVIGDDGRTLGRPRRKDSCMISKVGSSSWRAQACSSARCGRLQRLGAGSIPFARYSTWSCLRLRFRRVELSRTGQSRGLFWEHCSCWQR